MRPVCRVDQLRGDADPAARFAHRAFENIAHTQFAADRLHIDRLALVGEARIAGDDEEPADAGECRNDLSTMPSAKYSCSGSPLILANGSTAIDGLSGSGSTDGPAAAGLWVVASRTR